MRRHTSAVPGRGWLKVLRFSRRFCIRKFLARRTVAKRSRYPRPLSFTTGAIWARSKTACLWGEPLAIFDRSDERLHHLSFHKVSLEQVQLLQPKIKAGIISGSLGRIVGIATEVAKILHQHKRAIEFCVVEISMLRNLPQDLRPNREIAA